MPVTAINEVLSDAILYNPNEELHRSGGVHIGAIVQNLYYVQMKGYANQDIKEAAAILESGFTWEQLLENAWATRQGDRIKILDGVERPGELVTTDEYNGIEHPVYGTPDGEHKVNREIHELKLTTKSASKLHEFSSEFINFLWQGAAYCKMREYRRCIFWIMFIGRAQLNKEDQWKPARVYRVEFDYTEEEIELYWKTIMQHKNWMIKNGLITL